MYTLLKFALLALYLITALSLFIEPLADYQNILMAATVGLIVIHIAEYLVMKKRLDTIEGEHLIPVLLFGLMHWHPLIKANRS